MSPIAISLSVLGLVPLIYFAIEAVGPIPGPAELALVSLIDYAAVILAFAGGVHWGLALAPGTARPGLRFGAGVLPLIVAWGGLVAAQMVAPTVALAVLTLAYLATVLIEHQASRRLLVPMQYVWTRWGFTVVAMAMMIMVLVLRGVGHPIVF